MLKIWKLISTTMNNNLLTALRDKIEGMEQIHQLRVLEIIRKGNMDYTENANGIFINMSILNSQIVNEIQDYIKYIKLQQQQLDKIEKDKDNLKKTFYKDNKGKSSYRS